MVSNNLHIIQELMKRTWSLVWRRVWTQSLICYAVKHCLESLAPPPPPPPPSTHTHIHIHKM